MIKVCIIIATSIIYFIISLAITSKMKTDFYKFDSIIEKIDGIYYDSFDIFLRIKESIDNFTFIDKGSKSINLPKDSEIVKPKFGNVLMEILNNNRYSNDSLAKFSILYNGDACSVICNDKSELTLCGTIFSSILSRGIEQAVVQMGIAITSCLK